MAVLHACVCVQCVHACSLLFNYTFICDYMYCMYMYIMCVHAFMFVHMCIYHLYLCLSVPGVNRIGVEGLFALCV